MVNKSKPINDFQLEPYL